LEGGALLTPEFNEFSKNYVMFLHITTHIEGRKYDDLLGTVGGKGFPTLCMLDADGKVVAMHESERSVEAFQKTADKAKSFVDLRTKSEAGDKVAMIDYTLLKAEMGQMTAEELKKALPGLGKLSAEQQKKLDGVLANAMVDEIQKTAAGEKYAAMLAKGMIPIDEQRRGAFYLGLLEYADYKGDAGLFEQALDGAKEIYGSNPQAGGFFRAKEARLAELKAGSK
jgi:hypothetical protein